MFSAVVLATAPLDAAAVLATAVFDANPLP
jgi:hypothetical protein